MNNLFNCRRCGKIFSYSGKPVCPECLKKEDEDFEVAREYIKENPGHSMQEVSDATGVSIKQLTRFLKEGRIEFSDGSTAYLSCQSCGTPISSGRLCNDCLGRLGREIMQSVPQKRKAPPAADPSIKTKGMHLSRLKDK